MKRELIINEKHIGYQCIRHLKLLCLLENHYTSSFIWKQGNGGHDATATWYNGGNCDNYQTSSNVSGAGGGANAFPGYLGAAGEEIEMNISDYTNYLLSVGEPGSGGNGGNGPGSGGNGGGGGSGSSGGSSGSSGSSLTSGSGGSGGDGGHGGGIIFIKAKIIQVNGAGYVPGDEIFLCNGADGANGSMGSGDGGNGGDGGDAGNGNLNCSNNVFNPQGGEGAPGRGGDGADAGDGGSGGDAGTIWIVTMTSSLNLPAATSLADICSMKGGSVGAGSTTVGTPGSTGDWGSEAYVNSNMSNCPCFSWKDNTDGPIPENENIVDYDWIDESIEVCDCERAFELLTQANGVGAGYTFTNSSYVLPDEVSDGVVYEKSELNSTTSILSSVAYEVQRDHDDNLRSGYRLKTTYTCQLAEIISGSITTDFSGMKTLVSGGNSDFSAPANDKRIYFNASGGSGANNVGYYDRVVYKFVGNKPAGYKDFYGQNCLSGLAAYYGDPRGGRFGNDGDEGAGKSPENYEDDASDHSGSETDWNFSGSLPPYTDLGHSVAGTSTFSVYPSVVSKGGSLFINASTSAIYRVKMYNMTGELVFNEVLLGDIQLQSFNFSAGTYVLEIQTDDEVEKYKVYFQ